METTTKLVPGGSFMPACRGDEDRREVAVMGRENQADMKGGARCRSASRRWRGLPWVGTASTSPEPGGFSAPPGLGESLSSEMIPKC